MTWSFSIGRLFGAELRVHAGFFLLLAWIGTAAWLTGGPGAALVNVAFILALFACVVAHEFGHALAARHFGIGTRDVTLLPIGGMARLERMPEKPGQEIAVAVAGPAVNVAIWAVLSLALGVDARLDALETIEDPAQGFFVRLASVNLFLVLFNMIPAFPMDGGRVLRAVLSVPLGRVRATEVAALAGQSIAFLFGFVGLASGNLLLLLIAVFIFLAAAAESSDVVMKDRTQGVPSREAMITSFEALAPDDTLDAAAHAVLRTTQSEFPVLGPDHHLLGFLTRAAIITGKNRGQSATLVTDHMVRDVPEVELGTPLASAIEKLGDAEVPAVAVTDPNGNFLGYITRENIGEWLVLSEPDHGQRAR